MSENNKNIRQISFKILYKVFFNNKLLNECFNEYFEGLSIEDRAFVKSECTGVVERYKDLDLLIDEFSKIKSNKLDKEVLLSLRIGLYEMVYMEKIPVYATINECVNLVKKTSKNRLSSYVNALLRNFERSDKFVKSTNTLNKKCYFKVLNNRETEVENELNENKIVFKTYDGELEFKHSKIYYVEKYSYILNLDSFNNGDILIIDVSSAFYIDCLTTIITNKCSNNLKVLDTCASPGGKTFCLKDALTLKNISTQFEARDVSEKKIDRLLENCDRLKINDIKVKIHDATIIDESVFGKFDIVILDVPCSGLGVTNKKPDILLHHNDSKTDSLISIQRHILSNSKNYVKKNGLLSYSTCTENINENEYNIKDFIDNNSNFKVLMEKTINKSNSNDGFYFCIMEREY